MRIPLAFAACVLLTSPASADGFERTVNIPAQIDLSERRQELLNQLPTLIAESSRSGISAYRRKLDLFNTVQIQGLYSEIRGICERLNDAERNANYEWDKGNLSRNDKLSIDEAIKSERMKCSDKFANSSPYFQLYYEVLNIYKRLDGESLELLAACNSKDDCRNS